jgi:hypothetical protein
LLPENFSGFKLFDGEVKNRFKWVSVLYGGWSRNWRGWWIWSS